MRTSKFLLSSLMLPMVACLSPETLIPLTKDKPPVQAAFSAKGATASIDYCTTNPLTRSDNLKIIFVIDKSGSNAGDVNTPGTDPIGARRYAPLLDFLSTTSDPGGSVYFGLVDFSTTAKVVQNFTNDLPSFTATVRHEANPNKAIPANPEDAGWTDYLAALQVVTSMVQDDINQASVATPIQSSHYVIFWMSDGEPLVPAGMERSSDILNLVASLKGLEQASPLIVESFQFHTGFYFNDQTQDPAAATLMQNMATRGGGEFYQFSAGQTIDYNRFSLPQANLKFSVKDIFVDNLNTVWEGNELVLDSDGDGLSDRLELKLGSNPNLADSDGNGISDFVEYGIYGLPCGDPSGKCSSVAASHFSQCDGYRQNPGVTPAIYSDSDNDNLNDCEERLLNSNLKSVDTIGAWIPDELALKKGLSLIPGNTSEVLLDPDFDGLNNYMEIKGNTPISYPNGSIPGLKPYHYQMTLVSSDATRDCYHVEVSNIAAIGKGNLLKVYVMEATSLIDQKKYLRTATRAVDNHGQASFVVGDFQ